nr:hypothetical protein [Bacteroidota bacterium]
MKRKNSIIGWAFILSILVLIMMFVDFLALSDIHQDYVSTKVLDSIGADLSNVLPDWSATVLEWTMIRISLILKAIFMIVIIIALGKTVQKLKI